MRVVALTGRSGSGKTTAILSLIEHYVAGGMRVGVIKHTHHELNEEDRGDTSRFRRAGAEPVLLAGPNEAVVFGARGTRRVTFDHPRELLAQFDTDLVLVEGFKSLDVWPKIELSSDQWRTTDELLAIVDRIAPP